MPKKDHAKTATDGRRPRPADTGLRVYKHLRRKAVEYGMRPGERVNEVRLAEELNVSRTPVRAALNRLVSEGLLTVECNKGFFRPPIEIDTIRSLFEVRGALETLTVRLFCERASEEDILGLQDRWRAFQDVRGSLPARDIVAHDEAFHESVAAGSKNGEALRQLQDLNARIRFLRVITLEREGFKSVTNVEHRQIVEALARRDAAQATDLMSRHVSLMLNDIAEITREMVVRIYLGEEGDPAES